MCQFLHNLLVNMLLKKEILYINTVIGLRGLKNLCCQIRKLDLE